MFGCNFGVTRLFQCDSHFSLFGELRFSDKKNFKRFSFEFSQAKLIYSKEKVVNTDDVIIIVFFRHDQIHILTPTCKLVSDTCC